MYSQKRLEEIPRDTHILDMTLAPLKSICPTFVSKTCGFGAGASLLPHKHSAWVHGMPFFGIQAMVYHGQGANNASSMKYTMCIVHGHNMSIGTRRPLHDANGVRGVLREWKGPFL